MGKFIGILIIFIPMVLNIAIGIVSMFGIYSFTESIMWSIIGGFIIGSVSFTSAIVYPAVEYYYTSTLTVYSYSIVGMSITLLLWAFILSLEPSKNEMKIKQDEEAFYGSHTQDEVSDTQMKMDVLKALTNKIEQVELIMQKKDQITNEEYQAYRGQYQDLFNDLKSLMYSKANDMKYPYDVQEWSDTQPLSELNKMSDNKLMSTDMYQIMLNDFIWNNGELKSPFWE